MEWKHPSIIAIKGFPYTGKTSVASGIAFYLRICALLDLDAILDSITPPTPPPEVEKLTALAFDILCALVEDQLSVGVSVIIDSLPLSRPLLDRLVALSQSSNPKAKFIIVECKIPDDRKYGWMRRFTEEYSSDSEGWKWYKPRDWYEDVVKLIEGYDIRLDEPIDGVSRLFLNADQPLRHRHIVQAIQALIFCPDDRHLDYSAIWNKLDKIDDVVDPDHGHRVEKMLLRTPVVMERDRFCGDGHSITVYEEEGLVEYETNCGVCEKPVHGAAYTCDSCELVLHKSCAEMDSVDKRFRSFSPHEFPTFIRRIDNPESDQDDQEQEAYSFPENHACLLCREAGKGFSDKCSSCIFETHLKCRLVPTIIEHDSHEHKLYFWASYISNKWIMYKCAACGKAGAYTAYDCFGCEKSYHVECALLPYPIEEHLHGGYKHRLELVYERDKELENYPCDHCEEMMNPEDWYYHCPICPQTYHLKCAFLQDDD